MKALFAEMPTVLKRFAFRAAEWAEKRRQRRALSKLDDRLLRDIGVGRAEANREARKLF